MRREREDIERKISKWEWNWILGLHFLPKLRTKQVQKNICCFQFFAISFPRFQTKPWIDDYFCTFAFSTRLSFIIRVFNWQAELDPKCWKLQLEQWPLKASARFFRFPLQCTTILWNARLILLNTWSSSLNYSRYLVK